MGGIDDRPVTAGIDVGSKHDRTALVILDGASVVTVAELPVGLELAAQGRLLAPLVADCDCVAVDTTGLGLGLGEALRAGNRHVVCVTFVAGEQVRQSGRFVQAGKAWLVQRLAVAIGSRSLNVRCMFSAGSRLIEQLGNMRATVTASGGVKLEAPGVAADDLVMALALALLAQDIAAKRDKADMFTQVSTACS